MSASAASFSRTFLDVTREKLKAVMDQGLNTRDLARLSRGYIGYEWIRRFHTGFTPDPGVQRLQLLHDLCDHLLALPSWEPNPELLKGLSLDMEPEHGGLPTGLPEPGKPCETCGMIRPLDEPLSA